MNQKTIGLLFVAMTVLFGVYLAVNSSESVQEGRSSRQLFHDLDASKIFKIKLQQGSDTTELELRGNRWVVLNRYGFSADEGKVRSLLVKVLDLSVSQKVTENPSRHKELGVTDQDVKEGKTLVTFHDRSGNQITGIYLGNSRKSKDVSQFASALGEYIRRADQNDVYLISQSLPFLAGPTLWLDSALVNVLHNRVYSVAQSLTTDGAEKVTFDLVPRATDVTIAPETLVIKDGAPAGRMPEPPTIALVRAGLENAMLTDVKPATDDSLKELKFDRKTLYKLNNGLEYSVQTAESGDKIYAKLSVVFSESFAKELTARHEKELEMKKAALAAASPSPAPNSSTQSLEAPSPSPSPSPSPTPVPAVEEAKLEISSASEAADLNSRYSPWVYELPQYVGKRFRHTIEEVAKSISPEADASAETPPFARPPVKSNSSALSPSPSPTTSPAPTAKTSVKTKDTRKEKGKKKGKDADAKSSESKASTTVQKKEETPPAAPSSEGNPAPVTP